MVWLIWFCMAFRPCTRMALAMARSREEPWALMTSAVQTEHGAPP